MALGTAFDCPPLPRRQRKALVADAKAACSGLVANALSIKTAGDGAVVESPTTGQQVHLYKCVDSIEPYLHGTVAHMRVQSSLQEAADLFLDNSNLDHILHDKTTIDTQTLYTLVERPIADNEARPLHSLSLKWSLHRLGLGMPLRDTCFLEAHDELTVVDSISGATRRGWVRCSHSISLPCCPSMQDSHNVIRMTIVRSGHVFLETEVPGELDYYHVQCGSPHGALLATHLIWWYHQRVSKAMAETSLRVAESLVMRHVKPAMDSLQASHLQSKLNAKYCGHCYEGFGWFSPKRQCRCCGSVLCVKCTSTWTVARHPTVLRVSLCPACVSTAGPHGGLGSTPSTKRAGRLRAQASPAVQTPDVDYSPPITFTQRRSVATANSTNVDPTLTTTPLSSTHYLHATWTVTSHDQPQPLRPRRP